MVATQQQLVGLPKLVFFVKLPLTFGISEVSKKKQQRALHFKAKAALEPNSSIFDGRYRVFINSLDTPDT